MKALQTDDIFDEAQMKLSKNQRRMINKRKRFLRPLVFDKPIIHNGKRELPQEIITGILGEAWLDKRGINVSGVCLEFIPIEQWVAVSDYLKSRSFDVYGDVKKGLGKEWINQSQKP